MILFLTLFVISQDITLEKTDEIKLSISAAAARPDMVADREGNLYYRDYHEHKVVKLDKHGKVLFQFGRKGQGPGEIMGPMRIILVNQEKLLLIMQGNGHGSVFETSTGDFVEDLGFLAGAQLYTFDKTSFAVIGNAPNQDFIRFYDHKGEFINGWWPTPAPKVNEIYSRHFAVAIDSNKTAYFQDGTWPKLEVIKPGKKKADIWELRLPAFYREVPSKKMSNSIRFDRAKVQAYYSSFSQIIELGLVRDQYLIVGWLLNHEDRLASIDIYDIRNRKLIKGNLPVDGIFVCHNDRAIYCLEERDEINDDFVHVIHRYELSIDK